VFYVLYQFLTYLLTLPLIIVDVILYNFTLYPEDSDNKLLRNVGKYLWNLTAVYSKRMTVFERKIFLLINFYLQICNIGTWSLVALRAEVMLNVSRCSRHLQGETYDVDNPRKPSYTLGTGLKFTTAWISSISDLLISIVIFPVMTLWFVTHCSLVGGWLRLWGMCCLHLQDQSM
jgi:hypothetical protein